MRDKTMNNNEPTAIYCDITGMWLTIEDEEKYGWEPFDGECDIGDYEGRQQEIDIANYEADH